MAEPIQHPRNVYLREVWVVPELDKWLSKIFAPHRIEATIDTMASAYQSPPDRERDATRKVLAECNQKLASHRAALEAAPIRASSLSGLRKLR